VIDGSDPDLLAEQAVDDVASDDETEDDEKRCQTWPPVWIIARLLCCPRMGAGDHVL